MLSIHVVPQTGRRCSASSEKIFVSRELSAPAAPTYFHSRYRPALRSSAGAARLTASSRSQRSQSCRQYCCCTRCRCAVYGTCILHTPSGAVGTTAAARTVDMLKDGITRCCTDSGPHSAMRNCEKCQGAQRCCRRPSPWRRTAMSQCGWRPAVGLLASAHQRRHPVRQPDESSGVLSTGDIQYKNLPAIP